MGTTKCRHKQAALGHGQWGQSAAQLFLHIQFEHANQLGNWVGEQSCGGSLAIRGHIQKQFPTWFDGLADGTWNMQMPQIALRFPPLGHGNRLSSPACHWTTLSICPRTSKKDAQHTHQFVGSTHGFLGCLQHRNMAQEKVCSG